MHSEGYRLFASFWWLIFPVGWGIASMLRAFLSHKRAEQTLNLIKAYADQGREIPPEILELLRRPDKIERSAHERARNLLIPGFIFVALAMAFSVLIVGRIAGDDREAYIGIGFVVVLLLGIAAAFFITSYIQHQDAKRLDPP